MTKPQSQILRYLQTLKQTVYKLFSIKKGKRELTDSIISTNHSREHPTLSLDFFNLATTFSAFPAVEVSSMSTLGG